MTDAGALSEPQDPRDPITRLAEAIESVAAAQVQLNVQMKETVDARLVEQNHKIEEARESTRRWRIFASIVVIGAIIFNTLFGIANIKLNQDQTEIGGNVQDVLDYVNSLPSVADQREFILALGESIKNDTADAQRDIVCDQLDGTLNDSDHWDANVRTCVSGPSAEEG